jgi:hypothetical protein
MRVHVDAWDPGYGRSFEADEGSGPNAATSAPVNAGVERPATAWRPLTPPGNVRAPRQVLLVDGVRRIDAQIWVEDDAGEARPGLCASYAAGAVRCDLGVGAAVLVVSRVEHGLFVPGPEVEPLRAHARAVYRPHAVRSDEPRVVEQALQQRMFELEAAVSDAARTTTKATGAPSTGGRAAGNTATGDPATGDAAAAELAAGDDLLVVDGPLRGRGGLPRALGYAKTHQKQYLEPALARVVTALAPGQRTPLFLLGGRWHRYSWYLRLPGPVGAPWSGVVRLECPADWPLPDAVRYADVSAVTLPRFASTPYKDPRAPQNLVPIAGLERRLRALLGDPRLLLRGLRSAAARLAAVPG